MRKKNSSFLQNVVPSHYDGKVTCYNKEYVEDLITKGVKYNVKYIIYKNEILKPKYELNVIFVTMRPALLNFVNKIEKKRELCMTLSFNSGFKNNIEFYFQEVNHSYCINKIQSYPKGEWWTTDYPRFKANRIFCFDTESIQVGRYVLGFIYDNVNFVTKFEFDVVNY